MGNDGIRIDINQLDFNNGKEISLETSETNKININSFIYLWQKQDGYRIWDGINKDEAEYIITEFKNAGLLDDNVINMDEINSFLQKRYDEVYGEGKWESAEFSQQAAQQFYNIAEKIVTTYTSETATPQKPVADTTRPGVKEQTQEDKDQNIVRVEVQAWGDSALEGNNNANDCLYRIMKNYYSDIETGSDEWKALEQQIMDLNPNIYGTVDDNGTWTPARNTLIDGSRQNSVIYTGEDIKLPTNKVEETIPDQPVPQSEEPNQEGDDNNIDADAILDNLNDPEQIRSLVDVNGASITIDGAKLTYDKASNTLTIEKDGEIQTVNITPEDLGYTEKQDTGGTSLTYEQYNQYQDYAKLLQNNESWNTEYVKNLMDALATGNQAGSYVASSPEQKAQYLSEVQTYISNLQKLSGHATNPEFQAQYGNVITMANLSGQDPVQMYLDKVNDPDKDIATANQEMQNYWDNVSKLGAAYLKAKETHNTAISKSPAAEYLTGQYNDDLSYSISFDNMQQYTTAMTGYDGSETNLYGNDWKPIFDDITAQYNSWTQTIKENYHYDTNEKIGQLNLDADTKAKLTKLVGLYNEFKKDGGVYDNVVNVAFWESSPHKNDAKNLATNAETLLDYYFNGTIPSTIPNIDELLRIFENNVPQW